MKSDSYEEVTKVCIRCGASFDGYKNHTYCYSCFTYMVRAGECLTLLCNKCGNFFMSIKVAYRCRQCDNWQNKKQNSLFIYCAVDGGGLCKIGRTKDLDKRLGNLRTGNPRIKFLFYFEDLLNIDTEKIIHKKYESKRKDGEWFELSKSDIFEIIHDYKVDSLLLDDFSEIGEYIK